MPVDDEEAAYPSFDESAEPPLTNRERAEIRRMLEHERRAKWLWSLLRAVAISIGSVVTFVLGLREFVHLDIGGPR